MALGMGSESSSLDSVGSESESESEAEVDVVRVEDRVDELDVVVDVEILDKSGVVCASDERLEL